MISTGILQIFFFCTYKHDKFLVTTISECALNRIKRRVSDGTNISYDSVCIKFKLLRLMFYPMRDLLLPVISSCEVLLGKQIGN